MSRLEPFATADEAADVATDAIVAQLTPPGPKRLMGTGGRGPGPVYDRLARIDLDWSRVIVTLSDDRFVGPDAPESNERLIRHRLLVGQAAAGKLVPLRGDAPTAAAAAAVIEPAIRDLVPFDATLLGMGDDGHVASLFPTTPNLAAALDPDGERFAIGVEVPGLAPYVPRISLTGRALFASKMIVVLTSGDGKRALIERVLTDPAFAPPVAALIRQTRSPVRLLWSPQVA